jgi:hypothetical protein
VKWLLLNYLSTIKHSSTIQVQWAIGTQTTTASQTVAFSSLCK